MGPTPIYSFELIVCNMDERIFKRRKALWNIFFQLLKAFSFLLLTGFIPLTQAKSLITGFQRLVFCTTRVKALLFNKKRKPL